MKKKVAIVGVGLIGGSLGQALRQRGRFRVLGIARKPSTLRLARRLRAIDEGSLHLQNASKADIVVIATPVGTIVPMLRQLAPFLKSGTVVTDAGSVKGAILTGAQKIRWPKGVFFVGSHPLAGSHRTGVEAARADLFEGSACVVVPSHAASTRTVENLWREAGARTLRMSAAAHDAAVAVTSHLPHVVAHALVRMIARRGDRRALAPLIASSFRDMTRIAASDAMLWRQIFQANAAPLRQAVRAFERALGEVKRQLPRASLERFLKKSQKFRMALAPIKTGGRR
jgi:prephenate dehydrogenase